ncbi:uncharacterized protein BDZ99DRAFT_522750 [Mytilinidion resinicola]|uniref:Cora-domain-containing protein n=1 Tax=Mytilinidion resinicola TaxID=574789 RepID=A0A6A6YEW7_9PEZI|nr:uncharacterized protein BDZ99DRAFT_522750 [Mytilinidion resinicola]KAF2807118.1 hypothetical protein BDZ99DRAFT_522750 [Mytilinidion resinicola]
MSDDLALDVFQWSQGVEVGQYHSLQQVSALGGLPPCDLTVIFAPLDIHLNYETRGLPSLFKYYDFPNSFILERKYSVTQAFGTYEWNDGATCSWLHFLCKNIHIDRTRSPGNPDKCEIVNVIPNTIALRQADYSWLRSGYLFKRVPRVSGNISINGSSSSSTTTRALPDPVTLICFGAPDSLKQRCNRLLQGQLWERFLNDPYTILTMVVEELFFQLDHSAWNLSEAFGTIEHTILTSAERPGQAADHVDFVSLHTVAKAIIYLNEGVDAMLLTLEDMAATYDEKLSHPATKSASNLKAEIRYRRGLFRSTRLRLQSLEKRMSNIINLSFNLVTQQDSRVVQRDSSVMKIIAIVTLFFLPSSTIATIFGTQFFNFGDFGNGKPEFLVSSYFWVFWLVSICTTVAVFVVWWFYYRRIKRVIKKREMVHQSGV